MRTLQFNVNKKLLQKNSQIRYGKDPLQIIRIGNLLLWTKIELLPAGVLAISILGALALTALTLPVPGAQFA
jgi:hypothetical protein